MIPDEKPDPEIVYEPDYEWLTATPPPAFRGKDNLLNVLAMAVLVGLVIGLLVAVPLVLWVWGQLL